MGSENRVKIRIKNLSLSFGGVKALNDVSLDIKDNEILAIEQVQRDKLKRIK